MKMRFKFKIRFALLTAAFITTTLPGSSAVFPVATNPAVMEFAGGAVVVGTNYLVGYISGTNLNGQLVSGNGKLIGSPQVLGANPGFPPAAAVAGTKTNCLVVWSDNSLGSGVTMFGQIVSSNGSPAGAKFPLLAAAGSHGFQYVQTAASDGTNFLVVWEDTANANFYGQWVTASGALSGSEFLLFTLSGEEGTPNLALTFGRTNYLLVCQTGMNNSENTYGELITPGGGAGSALQINTTVSLDKNPVAVAFDGTNYLVVWSRSTEDNSTGWPDWELCGRLVSPTGNLSGDEQVLVTEVASFPALAFDGNNYLLAWGYDTTTTNTDKTIHVRFLDRSASAIGPIFTPFPAQGTNPPMLPVNGVLFDGTRYLLTATFGTFIMDGQGDVQGISGGDVYGKFLSSSTQPPSFTQPTITNGQPQVQLKVVPGQTYTIETSTDLLSWTPQGVVSSDSTNTLDLLDRNPVSSQSRLFYRAAIGNLLGASFSFNFLEFANGGNFGGGYTPASGPVSLNGYSAALGVENDPNLPAATNVFFTGPSGAGLDNAAGDPDNSNLNGESAFYESPGVTAPGAAPGGVWIVNYHGTNITFNVSDPQASARLVVPLPTVTVSGDVVQSVNWVYQDAATGNTLAGAPAYVTDIQVQIDGIVGGRIYNSPTLGSDATSHTLTSGVNWSNVSMIHMAYDDTLGNQYVVSFAKP